MKQQNTQKKKIKVNPAELNFIPNPQYLMENLESVDEDLKESTDVRLGNQRVSSDETSSENSQDQDYERREELIIKSGKFKFLNVKERKKFICTKCDEKAMVKKIRTGENFCYKHCIRKVFRNAELLKKSEISKKEYLENFKIRIEETKTDLEKAKSLLNNSRISSQEVNTENLHNVNLLFKHMFEETKHLYTCFLDQIGKKISESETTHYESKEFIQILEKDLQIIDDDIDRNYENIILSMEVNPFKEIMQSYEEKIFENLKGIEKAKDMLKKVKISKIEIKSKYMEKESKIEKILGNDLFDIVNKILQEEGETLTDEGLENTETLLTPSREQLNCNFKEKSGRKRGIDDYILTKKISTNHLRSEAEKIIIDLNKVIDQLEGKSVITSPKTPNIKKSSRNLSYLNSKKIATSTKKSKAWKNINQRNSGNSSANSRKKARSDKKFGIGGISGFEVSSMAKLSSIFSNKIHGRSRGLLHRKLSDVARLENILKKNSRTEKYGYLKPDKKNYTAMFDMFRNRSNSRTNRNKTSKRLFDDKGIYEYFRFPNERKSYTQNKINLGGGSQKHLHYYKSRFKKGLFDKSLGRYSGSPEISKSKSRNVMDSRYSSHSYNMHRKFSYGNKETQTRQFLKDMIKDLEKGKKNPFFVDERGDVGLKGVGKKYGFIGKDKHLQNWDMFRRASKRGVV